MAGQVNFITHRRLRSRGSRYRVTRATAKQMSKDSVVDLFEDVAEKLRLHYDKLEQLGPASLDAAKRQYGILRADLKRRGYSDEVLDGDEGDLSEYKEESEPLAKS